PSPGRRAVDDRGDDDAELGVGAYLVVDHSRDREAVPVVLELAARARWCARVGLPLRPEEVHRDRAETWRDLRRVGPEVWLQALDAVEASHRVAVRVMEVVEDARAARVRTREQHAC